MKTIVLTGGIRDGEVLEVRDNCKTYTASGPEGKGLYLYDSTGRKSRDGHEIFEQPK